MALEALAVICQCGFLASTLFTFHGHSCHEDKMSMACPYDTNINVRWAQYGRVRSSSYQCQHFDMIQQDDDDDDGGGGGDDDTRMKRSTRKELVSGEDCLASTSLEVVMAICQGKQKCKIRASHRTFNETPCPFSQLEVGYQCLPEFYSKAVSCTGTELVLQCPKSLKILIINATYGYRWPGEAKCQSRIGFDRDCSALCSPYVVTNKCHGHRTCRIFVDGQTFGDPCRPGTLPYLTVYYACVPARILNRDIQKKEFPFHLCDKRPTGSDNGYYRPSYLTTPRPTTTYKFILGDEGRLFPHWISVGVFIKKNIEKFILYVVLGAFIGLLLLLLVIIVKLILKSRFSRSSTQQNFRRERMLAGSSPWRKETFFRSRRDEPDIEFRRSQEPPHPGPATISAEELPSRLSAPDDGSPVFVHVESPRESPVLNRNNHWDNGSNGVEFMNGRSSPILRASSLPRHRIHPEHSLLLPKEREMALNGKSAFSEGQLRTPVEEPTEFVQPSMVSFRSTSHIPRQSEVPGDAGAMPLLVHTFSNPFRNDESLVKRKSSIRRKPAIL